jgi:hypothetical protein
MLQPRVVTWDEAPKLAIPESPALLMAASDLWLAYETTQEPRGTVYAVVRFNEVIDHRLSPINDEGLRRHPCARFGLQFYSFNEVIGSAQALEWAVLRARHWVVTFKDCTLDVLCRSASVAVRDARSEDPVGALFNVTRSAHAAGAVKYTESGAAAGDGA